jgi:hypothetical protein
VKVLADFNKDIPADVTINTLADLIKKEDEQIEKSGVE